MFANFMTYGPDALVLAAFLIMLATIIVSVSVGGALFIYYTVYTIYDTYFEALN